MTVSPTNNSTLEFFLLCIGKFLEESWRYQKYLLNLQIIRNARTSNKDFYMKNCFAKKKMRFIRDYLKSVLTKTILICIKG